MSCASACVVRVSAEVLFKAEVLLSAEVLLRLFPIGIVKLFPIGIVNAEVLLSAEVLFSPLALRKISDDAALLVSAAPKSARNLDRSSTSCGVRAGLVEGAAATCRSRLRNF